MSAIAERYGTVLRCYDNGGRSFDRYVIAPPRWDREYRHTRERFGARCDPRIFDGIAASECPFNPQGFGMWAEILPGAHLGKRVRWDQLPADVQRFARQAFPEYAPQ